MKKIIKKDALDFYNKITDILLKSSAVNVKTESDRNYYVLNTSAGTLNIIFESLEDMRKSSLYTVYTRFEEPDKAIKHYDCNPYSGKYNFHKLDKESCIDSFNSFITDVTNL